MSDVVDLFAGARGWSIGLRAAGHGGREVGYELDRNACATARAAGFSQIEGDLAVVDLSTIENPVDGVIASPPCPGFSSAGLGYGRLDLELIVDSIDRVRDDEMYTWQAIEKVRANQHDPRSALTLEPLRWALVLRPRWIALEQVPAVLPVWQAIGRALERVGYRVEVGTLHAEQYGVPQTRDRAVLVARRDHRPLALPTPTHSRYYSRTPDRLDPGVLPWVSMADALGITDAELAMRASVSNEGTRKSTPRDVGRPAQTITGKTRSSAWVYRNGNQVKSGRRHLDTPAPTVHFGHRSNKVEWMPSDIAGNITASGVRVTVAEAAALQTFPTDHPWQGSRTSQFLQVGNAVPPVLAAAILRQFVDSEVTP